MTCIRLETCASGCIQVYICKSPSTDAYHAMSSEQEVFELSFKDLKQDWTSKDWKRLQRVWKESHFLMYEGAVILWNIKFCTQDGRETSVYFSCVPPIIPCYVYEKNSHYIWVCGLMPLIAHLASYVPLSRRFPTIHAFLLSFLMNLFLFNCKIRLFDLVLRKLAPVIFSLVLFWEVDCSPLTIHLATSATCC